MQKFKILYIQMYQSFKNSLVVSCLYVQFTYHKIHLLRLYSSVVFGKFVELWNHHRSSFRIFPNPQKIPPASFAFVGFLSHSQPRPSLICFLSILDTFLFSYS